MLKTGTSEFLIRIQATVILNGTFSNTDTWVLGEQDQDYWNTNVSQCFKIPSDKWRKIPALGNTESVVLRPTCKRENSHFYRSQKIM